MDEIIEREVLQQWSDFLDAQIAHCEDGIFGNAENGSPIKRIDIECDFLPRVGDVFNTFNLFDDIEVEGNHYSIVYDIEWSIEGNKAVPIVKLNRYDNKEQNHRLDILSRHGWLPRGAR